MSAVAKFVAQLCLSKQGRKLLATTLLIILSPIILAFILVLSLAEGTQQHNNHMIDASFNDAPIGANTPVEFVQFVQNYQYAFVSGPNSDYLWLLSRTPNISPDIIEKFVFMSKQRGFNTDDLIYVSH